MRVSSQETSGTAGYDRTQCKKESSDGRTTTRFPTAWPLSRIRPEFGSCATTAATSASVRHESPMRFTRSPNVCVGFVVMSTTSSVPPGTGAMNIPTGISLIFQHFSQSGTRRVLRSGKSARAILLAIGKMAIVIVLRRTGLLPALHYRVDHHLYRGSGRR